MTRFTEKEWWQRAAAVGALAAGLLVAASALPTGRAADVPPLREAYTAAPADLPGASGG